MGNESHSDLRVLWGRLVARQDSEGEEIFFRGDRSWGGICEEVCLSHFNFFLLI